MTVKRVPLLFILLIALPISTTAWLVHPVWDDGWIMLLEKSGQRISEHMSDRPMLGWVWDLQIREGMLWTLGFALHYLCLSVLGVVTYLFWQFLFPNKSEIAFLPAVLAVCPVFVGTHYILITPIIAYQAGIVLTYGALLVTASKLDKYHKYSFSDLLIVLIGCLTVLCFCVVSEYAMVSAISGSICIASVKWRSIFHKKSVIFVSIASVIAIFGYILYIHIGDSVSRPNIRPEALLTVDVKEMYVRLIAFLAGIWSIIIGNIVHFVAGVNYSEAGVWLPIILIAGILLGVASYKLSISYKAHHDNCNISWEWHNWVRLLLVSIGGILPVALMGRSVSDSSSINSRFLLPLVPILASLFALLFILACSRKSLCVAIAVISFIIGVATATQAVDLMRFSNAAEKWSKAIRYEMRPAKRVVAIFIFQHARHVIELADYELTARITRNWNGDERELFWAYAMISDVSSMKEFPGFSVSCKSDGVLHKEIRGVKRLGPVDRLITVWIDGKYGIKISQ